MAFFVTIITGGPAQIFIFSMCWLVAATIIIVSSQGFGFVNPSYRGRALRPGAAGAAIEMSLIALIFLMLPARSLGFDRLRAMRRHWLCLLRAKQKGALVPGVILGRF